MDHDEAAHELEQAAERAFFRRHDTTVEPYAGGLLVTTPSSPMRFHNRVVSADAADAERVVEETFAHYRRHRADFGVRLRPGDETSPLARALVARGMTTTELVGLAVDVATFPLRGASDVTVERIDHRGIDAYVAASGAGWGSDGSAIASIREDVRAAVAAASSPAELFVAWRRGEPVGTGVLFSVSARSAYLLGGSVTPAGRGAGVYRALVDARVRILRDRGTALATVWAIATTSAPLCLHMGFVAIARASFLGWPKGPPWLVGA